MRITFDRILGILGVLLALPAFFDFLISRNKEEGALFSILVFLIVGFLFYRKREENRPLFTYLELVKILTFPDAVPDRAHIETHVKVKANHTGIQQMWFAPINADGTVENITVDGEPPFATKRKAGGYEVCKQFNRVLKSGDTEAVVLRYDLHNSFSGSTEGMTHQTTTPTKNLRVRVNFHAQKIGRNVVVFWGQAGSIEEPLENAPRCLEDGRCVEFNATDPRTGSRYTIEWKW